MSLMTLRPVLFDIDSLVAKSCHLVATKCRTPLHLLAVDLLYNMLLCTTFCTTNPQQIEANGARALQGGPATKKAR